MTLAPAIPKSARSAGSLRLLWPALALALLLAYNGIANHKFFHLEMRDGHLYGDLVDVLKFSVPVMLLALGMTLVIGTGGIDLSVGAVMAISGALAAVLIGRPDFSPLHNIDLHGSRTLVVLVALSIATLCGLWNGALVVLLDLQPIVATLILMVGGRGIAQLITGGQTATFIDPRFAAIGRGSFLALPFPITIAAVVAIALALLVRQTAIGLFVESVGNNPSASRLSGVPARWIKLMVYIITGLCAGIAGIIQTADVQGADSINTGLNLELDAILAVSVGGTALTGGRISFVGTIIGVVLMQMLSTTLITLNIDSNWAFVIKGIVVVAACMLQSSQFRTKFNRLIARRNRDALIRTA